MTIILIIATLYLQIMGIEHGQSGVIWLSKAFAAFTIISCIVEGTLLILAINRWNQKEE